MSGQTTEVAFNPARKEVYDLIVLALNDSAGDPSQTFADIFVASIIIGVMAEVDQTNMQDLIDRNLPNAILAAQQLIKATAENMNDDG